MAEEKSLFDRVEEAVKISTLIGGSNKFVYMFTLAEMLPEDVPKKQLYTALALEILAEKKDGSSVDSSEFIDRLIEYCEKKADI